MNRLGIAPLALLTLSCILPGFAAAQNNSADVLAQSSLEDLAQMKISVSSFARKTEDLDMTPAAVFVITSDQIEHSAANTIPGLLRMVPGVQVAQMNAYTWAVTARGFNNQYANKLLVLLDGRTVYSEIFSGVNWDEVDIPLCEIDRIEVIRGPGAAVWGTNAVNGVINIITKPVSHAIGTEIDSFASNLVQRVHLHYGGTLTPRSEFSLNLMALNRYPLQDSSGSSAFDGQNTQRISGRYEWKPTFENSLTVTGDLAHATSHALLQETPASGIGIYERNSMREAFLLGRWEHKGTPSDWAAQAYFSSQSRAELRNQGFTDTFDMDVQSHRSAGRRHDLVMGGEFRFTVDEIHGDGTTHRLALQSQYNNYLAAGFVEDDVTLVPHHLTLTLGTKLQDGTLAGFQAQPSVRLLWSPSDGQSLWAAASHAAVATSVAEIGIDDDNVVGSSNGLPVITLLDGNTAIKPQFVDAYEVGYRKHFGPRLSLDVAGYFNQNSRITAVQSGAPEYSVEYGPSIGIPATYVNGYRANSEGIESALTWKPSPSLNFAGAYTWMQAHGRQTIPGTVSIVDSWSSPRNSASLSASWAVHHGWDTGAFFQFVQTLSDTSPTFHGFTPGERVPGYARLDLHVTRNVARHLDLSAGGTNLLDARHQEFGDNSGSFTSLQVPRAFFLRAKVSF